MLERRVMLERYRAWFGPLILGGALGAAFMYLLQGRPAEAAEPGDKLDYIATLLEHLNATEILILDAVKGITPGGGVPGGVEVTVLTPWVAKEPELIFQQAIRSVGTFDANTMVDFTHGKRMVIKVESSLNQPIIIQPVGNQTNSYQLATNINGPLPCIANGNITIGFAWDDWLPYVGIRITVGAAPTAGIISIWAVIQE